MSPVFDGMRKITIPCCPAKQYFVSNVYFKEKFRGEKLPSLSPSKAKINGRVWQFFLIVASFSEHAG